MAKQNVSIKSMYIGEVLKDLNEGGDIFKYVENQGLKAVLEYSFNPELKFQLPEGAPPYKESVQPEGMSQTNFYTTLRQWYVFTKGSKDVTRTRREYLFIQLLEGLSPTEAKLILAIKDQQLQRVYPNLTREWLKKTVPGLAMSFNLDALPPEEPPVAAAKKTTKAVATPQVEEDGTVKRSRGRPFGSKTKKVAESQ
jgi:hypothetical protein